MMRDTYKIVLAFKKWHDGANSFFDILYTEEAYGVKDMDVEAIKEDLHKQVDAFIKKICEKI